MTRRSDLGTEPRYRLEVSMTRTESVAMVVEGPLEDLPRRAPFGHATTPVSTNRGLYRLSMTPSRDSSSKLLDRRRK